MQALGRDYCEGRSCIEIAAALKPRSGGLSAQVRYCWIYLRVCGEGEKHGGRSEQGRSELVMQPTGDDCNSAVLIGVREAPNAPEGMFTKVSPVLVGLQSFDEV